MNKFYTLVLAIFTAQVPGLVGSVATTTKISTWYADIIKPSFSPPNWIFGPVWLTLYTLIGIAFYLVIQANTKNKQTAYTIFGIHLFLNGLWSIVFFGFENPKLAFINIVLLVIIALINTYQFWKIDKRTVFLMAPYLAWISFASILNLAIWQLN